MTGGQDFWRECEHVPICSRGLVEKCRISGSTKVHSHQHFMTIAVGVEVLIIQVNEAGTAFVW